jgi:hypothetical protein
MAVKFYTENHKYESIDIFDTTKWFSASRIPSFFKKEFDAKKTAEKVSINKKSKWYGLKPEDILNYWSAENVRATTLGTWYHEQEENKLLGVEYITRYGKDLPIIRSIWEEGCKIAPEQKLTDGVYPEHLAYLKSVGVCGQFDEITVCDGYVYVDDHKTNRELTKNAYINWEGISEKMLAPLMHLEATKLNEYALQLSIGMYMILRHNPLLKPGPMTLNHVTFEIESEDQYGYPIMKLENNEPILKGIEKIEVPYLKREVELMFEFIKKQRA